MNHRPALGVVEHLVEAGAIDPPRHGVVSSTDVCVGEALKAIVQAVVEHHVPELAVVTPSVDGTVLAREALVRHLLDEAGR